MNWDTTNGFAFWKKGERAQLSEFFSTEEFDCHCSFSDCVEQRISIDLIDRLGEIRQQLNRPIYITSGYRCHKQQEQLRLSGFETAKGISQHELGKAVDLTVRREHNLADLVALCEQKFKCIGVGKTFVHVDLREDQFRKWGYVA